MNTLNGIPPLTLSQQVQFLEYKAQELENILGELIATIVVNCERGTFGESGKELLAYANAAQNRKDHVCLNSQALRAQV